MTPGLTQVQLAAELYHKTGKEEREDPVSFGRLLKSQVAFAGSMRANLCKMLDELQLHTHLGISGSIALFERRHSATAATSALVYPVFSGRERKNFSGGLDLAKITLFREMLTALLAPRLAAAPNALIIPFGNATESGLRYLISQQQLDETRMLSGFPHPSGANAHRQKHFRERKDGLRQQLERWANANVA